MLNNTSVFIGIPCYDKKIYIETSKSIFSTTVTLLQQRLRCSMFTLSGCALITHARNAIVGEFLAGNGNTHLLFVDSDMEWSPDTVLRMLQLNKPFVAAPYVQKRYRNTPTEVFAPADLDEFHSAVMDWNVEFEDRGILRGDGELVDVNRNFAKVIRIGAGLMLLRRDMLEQMVSKYAHTEYRWDGRSDNYVSPGVRYHGLFDLLRSDRGDYISEDYAFCDRWVKGCGGEIWCDLNAVVGHHGHHRYASSLAQSLARRKRRTSAPQLQNS